MSSLGLTLKLGMAAHTKQAVTYNGESAGSLSGRVGLLAGLGLSFLDGHGLGVDLSFNLRRYAISASGKRYGYGTFTAVPSLGARFQLARPLYLFLGMGPRIGVEWTEDAANNGLVAGFRAPVQLTYYMNQLLALTAEVGAGVEAIIWLFEEDRWGDSVTSSATGAIVDLSLGLRFR